MNLQAATNRSDTCQNSAHAFYMPYYKNMKQLIILAVNQETIIKTIILSLIVLPIGLRRSLNFQCVKDGCGQDRTRLARRHRVRERGRQLHGIQGHPLCETAYRKSPIQGKSFQ